MMLQFTSVAQFVAHLSLAVTLFLLINWIGRHAEDFGYSSTTLFENGTDALALNLFIRSLSPSVFIVLMSSAFVAAGKPEWRIEIIWVVIYYYFFRAIVIFVINRAVLVSWPRFCVHATSGTFVAYLAYEHLILPNKSLLPNLEQAGNEVWLAIFAFLYAAANKISVSEGPGARRTNKFILLHYRQFKKQHGKMIDAEANDEVLKSIIYSIMVYESYARPKFIRMLERLMFWKSHRTTGIMQVGSHKALSDRESVEQAITLLKTFWYDNSQFEPDPWRRASETIELYNRDIDYVSNVLDVMNILVIRGGPEFGPANEILDAYG